MAQKVVSEFIVPKGEAQAFKLNKGQVLRVIEHEGPQVASITFLNAHNYHEQFSARWSAWLDIQEGVLENMRRLVKLYSKVPWENVMLRVVEDTSKVHFPGRHCSRRALEILHREGRTCGDNFFECLAEFGLTVDRLEPAAILSLFMNWSIDKDARIHVEPPVARKGDYIDFLAEIDVLVGFSNCPCPNEANNFECKDMKIQVFE